MAILVIRNAGTNNIIHNIRSTKMTYAITSKYGHTYLGNSSPSKMEVHQVSNEKTNCQLSEILSAGHAVGFSPDTLAQAHQDGYDNCAYCIGGSTR